jgi:hypothetical protein
VQFSFAQEVLSGYDGRQTIWILNGLPYIERLNEGHSQQAPAGFVETAIYRNVRPVAELVA